MYRKTYLEVDCEKLENNIKNICKNYKEYKYFFGVVKANAYGHGVEVIKYLIKGGVNYLAVSSLEEALEIRKIDKKTPVLVMEPICYEGVKEAEKNDITLTIDSKDFFDQIVKDKIKIKFHLKVDSGMNRFGLKSSEDAKYIYTHSNEEVFMEGIFTHLSCGNGVTFERQISTFKEITRNIDLEKIPIIHLDRSLTLEQHEKINFANGVRLGIVMYGFNKPTYTPSLKRKILNKLLNKKVNFVESKLNLETVTALKSSIIEIKNVKAGEIIGYDGVFTNEEIKVGIVPLGFADYTYINTSFVSIGGKEYKILTVNMDVCIIRLDDNVELYDEVEFFGDNISIKRARSIAGVNAYKLLASVTDRVPRVYKYKNEKYEIKYREVGK